MLIDLFIRNPPDDAQLARLASVGAGNEPVGAVVFVHVGEQVAQIGILTTIQGAAVLTLKAGDQTVSFTVITGTPPAGSIPIIVAPIVGVQITQ